MQEEVEVSYHPRTYGRFFKPLESSHPDLMGGLLNDFAMYQQSDRELLPDYFGFDAEYGWPPEIAGTLEHIHLCIPPRKFKARTKQIDRKCKKGDPANDIALVYTRGLYECHVFCILGILLPDAHKKQVDRELMLELGRLAQEFRRTY
ncbi:type II toxin-antitoxin system YafO family toxin [Ectopseudomonas mendocina]|uniref:type II toxin-antitoxin system YafO family toxin n=1 Tax=Ectopseudomonas mendocina TaxID=300 RepID=UPI003F032DFF